MDINSSKRVQIVCKIVPCVENYNMNIWCTSQVYTVLHFQITTKYQKSINGNSLDTTLVPISLTSQSYTILQRNLLFIV